jgi:putative endonuclease
MTVERRRAALLVGHKAERLVGDTLEQRGWTVLCRNWRGGGGELDLVVLRSGVLRIVEVRARSGDMVTAEDSVTPSKQRKLRRAAEAWLLSCDEAWTEVAFWVVVVDLSSDPWTFRWIDNAFDVS